MYIWGLLYVPPMMRFKYFMTLVKDKNMFTWIFLMRSKYETSNLIIYFLSMVNNQFNDNIK